MKQQSEQSTSSGNKLMTEKSEAKQKKVAFLRRPATKYVLLGLGIFALLFATYAFYVNRPISVQIAAMEHNVPIRVFGLGTVEARVKSSIGFEVGATLVELNADHGDIVKQGDILAQLSLGEQEARVVKTRAALAVAGAEIEKADAHLGKVRSVLVQKQEANRRKQALVGRNVVSRETAEEAQREEDVAKADVLVALSDTQVAKALLNEARAQLNFEETMLRHRTLIAPYDAIVIERHKELGVVVKSGEPIFTLVKLGEYWGLAYVDEARAGYIQEDQKVDARLRSRPQDAFTGRVARIGLESDRVTEERRVFVKGDNPPPRIYLGEQVEFWITVAQLKQALLVPEAAVQGYDGLQGRIWTVEAGRLHRRYVKFRHRTEDARLEIFSGLPDGAKAVIRTGPGFRENRTVHIEESATK